MKSNNQYPMYEILRDIGRRDQLEVIVTSEATPHFHHQMEIFFISSGKVLVQINDEEHILQKGDIAIADSYDVHSYKFLTPDVDSKVFIIPKSSVPDYCTATKNLVLDFNFLFNSKIFQTLKKLVDVFEKNTKNNLLINGVAASVMGLVYSVFKYRPHKVSDKSYVMRNVLQYIHENYTENLNLELLAKRFGYSPNHFSTIFNFYTGEGLKDYINVLRAQHSLEAILSGVDISEAALSAGFESIRTFYRVFTKMYGQPPNSYLKKYSLPTK